MRTFWSSDKPDPVVVHQPEQDMGPTGVSARADEKITVNIAPTDVGLLDFIVAIGRARNRGSVIRRERARRRSRARTA